MPRSPLPRTLFAILPIFGALLAALAAHRDWPIPLSLFAMAVVALASAVIYWSAPLSARTIFGTADQSLPAASVVNVMSEVAAAAEHLPQPVLPVSAPSTLQTSAPEPGSMGTRADAWAMGEPHETDLLTGLLGSEAFFVRLARELSRCTDASQTGTLILCDLDGFGEINRTAGLVDANRMLRQVADCFRLTMREGDILCRLGGDEFGIFSPGLPPEIARARVRDLRAAVRDAGLLTLPGDRAQVTACIGTSCFPADGDTVDELMAAADLSLANAKRERREKANIPIPSALVLTRN